MATGGDPRRLNRRRSARTTMATYNGAREEDREGVNRGRKVRNQYELKGLWTGIVRLGRAINAGRSTNFFGAGGDLETTNKTKEKKEEIQDEKKGGKRAGMIQFRSGEDSEAQ